jgi:hypothetical protein
MSVVSSVIPDGIEPLVGWRAWRVQYDMLTSVYHPTPWGPREALWARHWFAGAQRTHESPKEHCSCGVYAYLDRGRAEELAETSCAPVFGTIALWGRVIEHEFGFKAEFAYPLELWVTEWAKPKLMSTTWGFDPKVLADDYGVPVHARRRPGRFWISSPLTVVPR